MRPNTLLMPEILDVLSIRKGFPILDSKANCRPLVYFDKEATTQKPWKVVKALEHSQIEVSKFLISV